MMEIKKTQNTRFLKLSLKKNRQQCLKMNNQNRSSDVISINDSFEKLDIHKSVYKTPKIYSPIVINDSSEESYNETNSFRMSKKEPSKNGNVSFNCTNEETSILNKSQPSFDGWSPAQKILFATPKQVPIPSTPKDVADTSLSECSIKKIHQSHKKVLDDLYGETWKSIPRLFKDIDFRTNDVDAVKKLQFEDDDSDKENIKTILKRNKELYLTESDIKCNKDYNDIEKKSRKKLFTEIIPSTPDIPRQKPVKIDRNVKSTVKKKKGMTVTQMVEVMNEVDELTKKVKSVTVTPVRSESRLSFMASLADDIPPWKSDIEAIRFRDTFKETHEQLARKLYNMFNRDVFNNELDEDMPIFWDNKLRSTAGTTTNRRIKNSKGEILRTSSIKLSTKVVDTPQRLRDTLIHELCHAATWLIDGELKAGHGPLWKKWAKRSLRVYPELDDISRCHTMQIHHKYKFTCTKCGYTILRHSKSIDVSKKCCGYCKGTFEIIINKKNKDGAIVSTPARQGKMNEFALYVKENYSTMKDGTKTHAQVMKILGEQFSAQKKKVL